MDDEAARYIDSTFGNYTLCKRIGEGGFAEVYLGRHLELDTVAAVKVSHTKLTDKEFGNLRQEAQLVIGLTHSNIIQVRDFGFQDNVPFLVMSYAPYGSLRDRFPVGTCLPLQTIIPLVQQVAAALQYAHNHQVIHRDLKPENLLIGNDEEIVLSDFGTAIVAPHTSSQITQDAVGTIEYMAPEQICKKAQPASDQYALGIIVYEWLSGNVPFTGEPSKVLAQHLNASPPSLRERIPDISPALEKVLQKALEKDPEKRFPSVLAFAEALAVASEPSHISSLSESNNTRADQEIATRQNDIDGQELLSNAANFQPRRKDPPTRKTVLFLTSMILLIILGVSGVDLFFLLYHSQARESRTPVSPSTQLSSGITPTPVSSKIPTAPVKPTHPSSTPQPATNPTTTPLTSTPTPAPKTTPTPIASPTPTPSSQSITATLPLCQGNTIVHSVAWSPNGQLLASATASDDGKTGAICIWNRKTGQSIPTTISSLLPVFTIAWSPNSQFIAAGGYDYTGTIQIWDINHPDAPLRTYKPSTGLISTVYAIAWSPDGKSLASGGPDQTIRIWDPSISEANATPLVQKQYTGAIFSIDWAPDGTRLALGLNNGTAQIINAQTGSALSVLPSHQHSTVGAVAWSPDGAHLASGNWDGTIQMWDPATGTLLFTDSGHTDAVSSIAWSPDDAFIASGSNDTTVRIWDVHAPGPARFVYRHHKNQVHAVSWSPTADVIASGDFFGIVQIWSPFES